MKPVFDGSTGPEMGENIMLCYRFWSSKYEILHTPFATFKGLWRKLVIKNGMSESNAGWKLPIGKPVPNCEKPKTPNRTILVWSFKFNGHSQFW